MSTRERKDQTWPCWWVWALQLKTSMGNGNFLWIANLSELSTLFFFLMPRGGGLVVLVNVWKLGMKFKRAHVKIEANSKTWHDPSWEFMIRAENKHTTLTTAKRCNDLNKTWAAAQCMGQGWWGWQLRRIDKLEPPGLAVDNGAVLGHSWLMGTTVENLDNQIVGLNVVGWILNPGWLRQW